MPLTISRLVSFSEARGRIHYILEKEVLNVKKTTEILAHRRHRNLRFIIRMILERRTI
jgi:hypothetical protein